MIKCPNRPSHIPIPIDRRPEILLVCRAGWAAEILLSVLKSADYSVTHASTETEALDWLPRRCFHAAVLEESAGKEELLHEMEARDIPEINFALRPHYSNAGITAEQVKQLLAELFRVAPLEWSKSSKNRPRVGLTLPA